MLQDSVRATPNHDRNSNYGSHAHYYNIAITYPLNTLQRNYYMAIANAYIDRNDEVFHPEHGYCDVSIHQHI